MFADTEDEETRLLEEYLAARAATRIRDKSIHTERVCVL
jgi:hypothetical protein